MTMLLLTIALLAAQPSPAGCRTPEHRRFDFWIGSWEVRTTDGRVAGTNLVTAELGGCAIVERWSGARGVSGMSLNAYDAALRKWHQTWMDSTGLRLELGGDYLDGSLRLEGRGFGAAAAGAGLHRITWTPNRDGTIRQHWQTTTDGGSTWTDVFDGIYHRKP